MGFSQEAGYIPTDIATILSSLMVNINGAFGTSYTNETFVGSNHYKFFYALAQRMQENEVKTSEIFLKLQTYISLMNERISRPVNTNPGIIEKLESMGYISSVKPMIDADAGKQHICVDVDDADPDYATTKLALCTLISQITVGGSVTQGTEVETIALSNGQSFDFKYLLPERIPIKLKLTLTLSENNLLLIGEPDETKQKLLNQIRSRYRLGRNFEPQRYFAQADAPWTGSVLLQYSLDDGATWSSTIYDADFDELFTFGLDDIELVEA